LPFDDHAMRGVAMDLLACRSAGLATTSARHIRDPLTPIGQGVDVLDPLELWEKHRHVRDVVKKCEHLLRRSPDNDACSDPHLTCSIAPRSGATSADQCLTFPAKPRALAGRAQPTAALSGSSWRRDADW